MYNYIRIDIPPYAPHIISIEIICNIPKQHLRPRPLSPNFGFRHAEKGIVHHFAAWRPHATVSLQLEQLELLGTSGGPLSRNSNP